MSQCWCTCVEFSGDTWLQCQSGNCDLEGVAAPSSSANSRGCPRLTANFAQDSPNLDSSLLHVCSKKIFFRNISKLIFRTV